jgi:hypothetical protein
VKTRDAVARLPQVQQYLSKPKPEKTPEPSSDTRITAMKLLMKNESHFSARV